MADIEAKDKALKLEQIKELHEWDKKAYQFGSRNYYIEHSRESELDLKHIMENKDAKKVVKLRDHEWWMYENQFRSYFTDYTIVPGTLQEDGTIVNDTGLTDTDTSAWKEPENAYPTGAFSADCCFVFDNINTKYEYRLQVNCHKPGAIMYCEYSDRAHTTLTNVMYLDDSCIVTVKGTSGEQTDTYEVEEFDGCIKFHETTKCIIFYCPYIEGVSFDWWGPVRCRGVYTNDCKDYYSYPEVMPGYLPNPDSGVIAYYKHDLSDDMKVINQVTDEYIRGNAHWRHTWRNVQVSGAAEWDKFNESEALTSTFDFSECEEVFSAAIEQNARVYDGAFACAFTGYDPNNSNVYIDRDNKKAYVYCFPHEVFKACYLDDPTQENHLIVYELGEDTVQDKDDSGNLLDSYSEYMIYNVVPDWGNTAFVAYYKTALQKFSDWLDETTFEKNGYTIKYRSILSMLQIRFYGFWGEGHYSAGSSDLRSYVSEEGGELETLDELKAIIQMYIDIFPDIRLMLPSMLVTSTMDVNKTAFIDFAVWLLANGKNDAGWFGAFDDGIGNWLNNIQCTHEALCTDGETMLDGFAARKDWWQRAPYNGETWSRISYGKWPYPMLDVSSYVRYFHVQGFRSGNLTNTMCPSLKTDNPAVYLNFKDAFDVCGYHIFFMPITVQLSGSTLTFKMLVGNMGTAPIYASYWRPQIVIRNTDGSYVDAITLDLDPKEIPLMSEAGVPNWRECLLVDNALELHDDINYEKGQKVYLRFLDKKHYSPNMFLAAYDRTENGEYDIGIKLNNSYYKKGESHDDYDWLYELEFNENGMSGTGADGLTVTQLKVYEEYESEEGLYGRYTADGYESYGYGLLLTGFDLSSFADRTDIEIGFEYSRWDLTDISEWGVDRWATAFAIGSADSDFVTDASFYRTAGPVYVDSGTTSSERSKNARYWRSSISTGEGSFVGSLTWKISYSDIDTVSGIRWDMTNDEEDEYTIKYDADFTYDRTTNSDVPLSDAIKSVRSMTKLSLLDNIAGLWPMRGTIKRFWIRAKKTSTT